MLEVLCPERLGCFRGFLKIRLVCVKVHLTVSKKRPQHLRTCIGLEAGKHNQCKLFSPITTTEPSETALRVSHTSPLVQSKVESEEVEFRSHTRSVTARRSLEQALSQAPCTRGCTVVVQVLHACAIRELCHGLPVPCLLNHLVSVDGSMDWLQRMVPAASDSTYACT